MPSRRADLPSKLPGPVAARRLLAGCFADCDPTEETVWVAHLDDSANCVHLSQHGGDEVGAELPIRSIIADAASRGSAAILLAHNHPSGDPTPSLADCRATRRLAAAAEALDCRLLDHLVFAGGECRSFRTLGLL